MSITKEECAELVRQAYATYNQTLPKMDEKVTFRAWYQLLKDLEYDDCQKAFIRLATHATFMPRPGDVRRSAIDAQTKIPPHLDAYSAWGIFQQIVREVNSGTQTEIPKPEALIKTLQQLGDGALGMHTNGDREVFVRTYERVCADIDKEKYAIKDGE